MSEHTWKQVLTPYALMGGTAGAMMAYLAWWHRMNPPGTEVRVRDVRGHNKATGKGER